MAFNVEEARRAGYSDDEIYDYLKQRDLDRIDRYMQSVGKPMLPVEYAPPPPAQPQLPAELRGAPAGVTPPVTVRRQMTPEEQRTLWSEQGIQPTLPPMSLMDMAMLPVQALEHEVGLPLTLLATVRNPAGKVVPGELSGTGRYMPTLHAIEREARKLLTLGELTDPQARRQAESTLRWQEWERPRLESEYGALRPGAAGASKSRLLQNTPEAVDARIQRALDYLDQPAQVWTPTDYGIFDRNLIQLAREGFPGVPQTVFPRRQSTRADVSYVPEIYQDPRNRELIKRQIARGLPQGGETFYPSYYPILAEWMERGGTQGKFNEWAESVSPASARNSLYNEQAVGNFLRMLHYDGVPLTEENVRRAMDAFRNRFRIGLPLMGVHREGAAKVLEQGVSLRDLIERDLTDSYKIPTYATQKTGDFAHSYVGDVHEAAGGTLGSRYHPYFKEQGGFGGLEYGPAESQMREISREMGLPTGTGQAGRWFGGGGLTGLRSEMGDALDAIEKQAAYTMHQKGMPTDPKSVRDYVMGLIERGGEMLPWFRSEPMPEMRTFAPGSAGKPRPKSRRGRSTQ